MNMGGMSANFIFWFAHFADVNLCLNVSVAENPSKDAPWRAALSLRSAPHWSRTAAADWLLITAREEPHEETHPRFDELDAHPSYGSFSGCHLEGRRGTIPESHPWL